MTSLNKLSTTYSEKTKKGKHDEKASEKYQKKSTISKYYGNRIFYWKIFLYIENLTWISWKKIEIFHHKFHDGKHAGT
jgi:hypothetical protein